MHALDARVALVGAMVFALAAASIWRPGVLARAAMRRRIARRAATVMTVLALLPAVVPYDHLLPGLHIDGTSDAQMHALHCHVSPGSCSDVPLASGFGEFVFTDPLVTVPAMLAVAVVATTRVLRRTSPRPEVRPPEVLAAA